jgi:hypothetical protein
MKGCIVPGQGPWLRLIPLSGAEDRDMHQAGAETFRKHLPNRGEIARSHGTDHAQGFVHTDLRFGELGE